MQFRYCTPPQGSEQDPQEDQPPSTGAMVTTSALVEARAGAAAAMAEMSAATGASVVVYVRGRGRVRSFLLFSFLLLLSFLVIPFLLWEGEPATPSTGTMVMTSALVEIRARLRRRWLRTCTCVVPVRFLFPLLFFPLCFSFYSLFSLFVLFVFGGKGAGSIY